MTRTTRNNTSSSRPAPAAAPSSSETPTFSNSFSFDTNQGHSPPLLQSAELVDMLLYLENTFATLSEHLSTSGNTEDTYFIYLVNRVNQLSASHKTQLVQHFVIDRTPPEPTTPAGSPPPGLDPAPITSQDRISALRANLSSLSAEVSRYQRSTDEKLDRIELALSKFLPTSGGLQQPPPAPPTQPPPLLPIDAALAEFLSHQDDNMRYKVFANTSPSLRSGIANALIALCMLQKDKEVTEKFPISTSAMLKILTWDDLLSLDDFTPRAFLKPSNNPIALQHVVKLGILHFYVEIAYPSKAASLKKYISAYAGLVALMSHEKGYKALVEFDTNLRYKYSQFFMELTFEHDGPIRLAFERDFAIQTASKRINSSGQPILSEKRKLPDSKVCFKFNKGSCESRHCRNDHVCIKCGLSHSFHNHSSCNTTSLTGDPLWNKILSLAEKA